MSDEGQNNVQPSMDRSEGTADRQSASVANHRDEAARDAGGHDLRVSELRGDAHAEHITGPSPVSGVRVEERIVRLAALEGEWRLRAAALLRSVGQVVWSTSQRASDEVLRARADIFIECADELARLRGPAAVSEAPLEDDLRKFLEIVVTDGANRVFLERRGKELLARLRGAPPAP